MFNNTFTATLPIQTDSYLADLGLRQESAKVKRLPESSESSVLKSTSQYSIEVMRNHVRMALNSYEFENATDEVDYLLRNFDVFKLLPNLGTHLHNAFGANSKLTLELLNESPEWQTLFINVHTKCDWENSKVFVDTFLDNMFELFPSVAEKLNININPDGV
jgi:hypothetical protein